MIDYMIFGVWSSALFALGWWLGTRSRFTILDIQYEHGVRSLRPEEIVSGIGEDAPGYQKETQRILQVLEKRLLADEPGQIESRPDVATE